MTVDRPLRIEEASPTRWIEQAQKLAGHTGVRRKVVTRVRSAHFDLQALSRALANLIDNAVKFSPAGSSVRIALRDGRLEGRAGSVDALVVSVLDRGHGVDAEDRERIFAPFACGSQVRKGRAQGIGIGLYEAWCLARRDGGSLEHFPRTTPTAGSRRPTIRRSSWRSHSTRRSIAASDAHSSSSWRASMAPLWSTMETRPGVNRSTAAATS